MRKTTILFLLLASSCSFAGSQTGTVQKLFASGRDYAPPNQNPTHTIITGEYIAQPACATSGYWAINTETEQGKAMLTLLLTAYATEKNVTLLGTGNCSLRPDMETVFQVGFDN